MDDQDKIFAIADKVTKHNFQSIWEIEKNAMDGLQKREIAEEMFFKGIAYTLDHLNTIEEIDVDNVQKKIRELI